MTAITQPKENVADTVDSLAAKIGFVVGVDEENCAHLHYPATDTIKVFPVSEGFDLETDDVSGEPEHVEELDGRPLAAWCEYVEHKRGWEFTTHRAPEGF